MFAREDEPWSQAYKAVMLELDRQKLPERIAAANEAVQLRLKEIQGDTDHNAERQQIEDAMSVLRTLERERSDSQGQNPMSEMQSKPSQKDWRDLAAAAS